MAAVSSIPITVGSPLPVAADASIAASATAPSPDSNPPVEPFEPFPEAVRQRAAGWYSSLRPWNDFDEWLVEDVASITIQIEAVTAREAALRESLIDRARFCWDEDRQSEAESLGAQLPKKPSIVVRQLRLTRHGCEWLLVRWESLARILETNGDWNESQRKLALDLLGVPESLREGDPRLHGGTEALTKLVESQIADLKRLKAEALDLLDARQRENARAGNLLPETSESRALRRERNALHRSLRWTIDQLRRGRGSYHNAVGSRATGNPRRERDDQAAATSFAPAATPTPPPSREPEPLPPAGSLRPESPTTPRPCPDLDTLREALRAKGMSPKLADAIKARNRRERRASRKRTR